MNWFRRVIQKARQEAQLEKELEDHVARQAADYVRSGI